MRILRRYIALNLLQGWLVALVVTAAVFGLIGLIGELDRTHLDYDALAVLRYSLMVLPQQLLGLAPVVMLLGSVLAFAGLARHNEMTIISCAGVSLRQLLLAVALPTLAAMITMWLAMEYVTVPLHQSAEQERVQLRYRARVWFPEGAVWSKNGHRYIRLGNMLAGNRPADIALYQFNEQGRLLQAVHADTATVEEDRRWVFEGVQEKRLVDGTLETRRLDTLTMENLWAREELPVLTLTSDSMRLQVLWNYGRYLTDNQSSAKQYLSAFWQRITLPLTSAAMVILAVPVAAGAGARRASSVGLNLALGAFIGILFYLGSQIVVAAGQLLNWSLPLVSLLPAVVILVCAGVLARRMHW